MKTLVLNSYNEALQMVDREIPSPGPDEVLVKVKACGICQTDLKIIRGDIPPPIVNLPHVLGHEVVGEISAIGENVTEIHTGDVGVVYSYVTCHKCMRCLTGRENLCDNLKRVGFELEGGFREYLVIPAYNFCPFQKSLDLHKMAILADAIGTSYHAITTLARVKPGQDVLIVGAGGLGIHAVQIAKLSGARVIVVDIEENALDLAKKYGADETLKPEKAEQALHDLTQGAGVDAVIEIVGAPETLKWSFPSLKSGGRLIIVGYAPGRPFPLDTMAMHYHEYEIKGSRFVTKAELLDLIKLVERGEIEPVVTKTYPFAQANDALDALRNKTTPGRIALTL
ncbi:MAG: alcohol dehydrogenase catalytic domain-containing protein [Deltaproteobacteria bacterium]|nr:alcohol dehydrogenase catalytic domain-containing protein [Deltaproteobacteria bacterium]MBW1919147.1 alcohol dehydrogenase catalytic domain-containing protein [Deltaproteobacteria bacterium]MBW1934182.1 alcohol dehydrogenase catalytic domain-containing protein [Deltaproteobacteria bacterium]MBW1976441.1 alcohol dehydrogenase catalytic domain-containing protein [Deltaproteobacteria bacterium]MBW2043676.1 alcohol dehydrogenase catalytic domain-containing protein [Deltaproteobacteria bacterium